MSSIAVTCPGEIGAANHKIQTAKWWADPEYRAIVAKRIEGQTCEYCSSRPATTVHHDADWMYVRREAYFDPANMTPICGPCHHMYRDRLALITPESVRIGFRMLKPHELAAAQSFPKGYKFTGNRGEVVKQIGNAVCPLMAEALTAGYMQELAGAES